MLVSGMLEYRSLASVELETTSKGGGGPTNVRVGAVTAALLTGKFIYNIGSSFSWCPGCRAVSHNQRTNEVGFTEYSQFEGGVLIYRDDSSLDDVLDGITLFTVSIMKGVLMIDGNLVFGRGR